MDKPRTYICIDIKSFYASVECQKWGGDPLTTNLVVTDVSRTEKTICLAISPFLKAYGIPSRAQLFEVAQQVKSVNAQRKYNNVHRGESLPANQAMQNELKASLELALSYIATPPQMAKIHEVQHPDL